MNSVNLLPQNLRPRTAAGARENGAYLLLGTLVVLLLAVTVLVLTSNGIASKRTEIAQLRAEKADAQRAAGALSLFGDFEKVKATRVESVKGLAAGRLDWERAMREIARVLPDNVWLTALEGATVPTAGSAAPAATDAPLGPSLKLSGCADKQTDVATTLLRLRQLNLATDVKLDESSRSDTGAAAPSSTSTTDSGPESCGSGYNFSATIQLAASAATPTGDERVPVALGGGS